MKLDPRIVTISHILSPIETEEAEKYIGEMCYFADGFYTFSNLDKCPKAKLNKIHYDSKDFPYEWTEDFEQYTYILPVKFVKKPKEDKYVPFETVNDFANALVRYGLDSNCLYYEWEGEFIDLHDITLKKEDFTDPLLVILFLPLFEFFYLPFASDGNHVKKEARSNTFYCI